MDVETVSHFATPNYGKSPNCIQSGSQEAPQIQPKIIKNVRLGLKWSPRVSKMTFSGIKTYPFQQSTCQQLPVDRGRRQGAKPLNICIYIYIYTCFFHMYIIWLQLRLVEVTHVLE
jgi:hypothetical protein